MLVIQTNVSMRGFWGGYLRDFSECSFGVFWIRISDPMSLGSWYIKGTDESATRMDSSVPLMHHDPGDLGSLILIQIIPKERTLGKGVSRYEPPKVLP